MYSQCPDCQTRFRVTADALRAARGTVRCGRCGSAFDALERLTDFIPPPGDAASAPPLLAVTEVGSGMAAGQQSAATVEYHFSAEDLERVFVEASEWHEVDEPLLAEREPAPAEAEVVREPAGAGAEAPIVVEHGNAGFEDITLEGERISIEALTDSLPAIEPPAAEVDLDSTDELQILGAVPDSAYPEEIEVQAVDTAAVDLDVGAPEPATPEIELPVAVAAAKPTEAPTAESPTVAAEPAPLSAQRWRRPVEEPEPEPAATESSWRRLAWTFAGLLLALALAAQVAHHFRQDLVRHPQLGPPLRAMYERLGLDLLPNWDLASLELRQWGNEPDAATSGRLMVRASLTNRATFAQPHPLLRLELEDRFGNTVATRDFEPSEYLKNPSQATRLMAPGASSEAELLLADPGRDAVGYRLDVCLRESATLLRCAAGPG
jgi:predicted Zn finger-like uncharacterized protein